MPIFPADHFNVIGARVQTFGCVAVRDSARDNDVALARLLIALATHSLGELPRR